MKKFISTTFIGSFTVASLLGCSPVTSTQIGPKLAPKAENCDIEILEDGATPSRPYRDVGMISLKNCQEYATGPCKTGLVKEACRLGGDVVYGATNNMNDGRPDSAAGAVTFTLSVGAYVSNAMPSKDDAIINATGGVDCNATNNDDNTDDTEDPEDQMCVE